MCAATTTATCPAGPTRLAGALSQVIGGPVGRHALIGRARFLTPLRVMFAIAVVFLAFGYTTKAACLVTTGSGTADQKVANWQNQRAYYELCYSDTVPLYTAELLNLGKFPYKSSWIETDSEGRPQKQFDGNIAVRYMEYPVITGVYQYMSMALAKSYSALSKLVAVPSIAEVVMFFNISAFGLALAWFATVWSTAKLAGRRIWDAALVAGSPIVIFQIFTNFDALATAFAVGAILAWARRKPALAGRADRVGRGGQAVPDPATDPVGDPRSAHRAASGSGQDGRRGGHRLAAGQPSGDGDVPAGVVGVLPAQRPSRRRHGLAVQRGEVLHRLARLRHRASACGSRRPSSTPSCMVLFVLCCAGIAYVALTAEQRPRLAQVAFLVVALFLLTNKVWSPQFSLWLVPLAVLALPHRRILLAWMTIDALVWVPRMLYLYGEQNRGLPEQWFTVTVLLRDIAVIGLCALVIRQIYRPELDLVRHHGRIDDPSGGVFDRAPDRPPGWLPKWLRPTSRESAISVPEENPAAILNA